MKQQLLSLEKIQQDFPILTRKINGKRLVYLDSASTSQKPSCVIEAEKKFYEQSNANVHRGIYKLSEEATEAYENSRANIATFIGALPHELIFTRNTTESLNLLAYSLTQDLKAGDEIIVTEMEHHSNLVPWQQLAKLKDLRLKFAKVNLEEGNLDIDNLTDQITKNTKIVSCTHVSNVLDCENDIEEIAKIAHENNSLCIVDAAQSVPHMQVNIKKFDVDFLAFSGHKMLGPLGIGCLYGKFDLLKEMKPFLYGGDMIKQVTLQETQFNDLPWKFEAGTPNIAGVVGLNAAVNYLREIEMDNVQDHGRKIATYALKRLSEINRIKIYGVETSNLVSFNLDGVHSHDVATILDAEGIAIRAGHHCCMPLMQVLGVQGTCRSSFYIYNTKEDVDALAEALEKVNKIFGK